MATSPHFYTGINVHLGLSGNGPNGYTYGWAATLNFQDTAFCSGIKAGGPISTSGVLRTQYLVEAGTDYATALTAAVRALVADAARMGIVWHSLGDEDQPPLYTDGPGWADDWNTDLPISQEEALAIVENFEATWEDTPQKSDLR